MTIEDYLYGEFNIEPILCDLINTKEVQRLKKIHQGGASYLVNPTWNVTRYEHSIGTMLFIKLMKGTLEEQIAALLHDISHTAFSHVVDFALNYKDEDYHEKIYKNIIEESYIPQILNSYGYDYKDILFNESKWTILEMSAPSLCADRIDYTLRDMYRYGYILKQDIDLFLNNLTIVNGEIMITSIEVSEWFTDTYYKEVIDFFLNPLNIYAYNKLSKAISVALNKNIITLDDLLKHDEYVFNLMSNSTSIELQGLISSLNYNIKAVEDKNNYDIFTKNKLRLIDPHIFIENNIYRASEKSTLVSSLGRDALSKSKEGVYLKIL